MQRLTSLLPCTLLLLAFGFLAPGTSPARAERLSKEDKAGVAELRTIVRSVGRLVRAAGRQALRDAKQRVADAEPDELDVPLFQPLVDYDSVLHPLTDAEINYGLSFHRVHVAAADARSGLPPRALQRGACTQLDRAHHDIEILVEREYARIERGVKRLRKPFCKAGLAFNRRIFRAPRLIEAFEALSDLEHAVSEDKITELLATSDGQLLVRFAWHDDWRGDVFEDEGVRFFVVLTTENNEQHIAQVDPPGQAGRLGAYEAVRFAGLPSGRCTVALYRVPGDIDQATFLGFGDTQPFADREEIDVPPPKAGPGKRGGDTANSSSREVAKRSSHEKAFGKRMREIVKSARRSLSDALQAALRTQKDALRALKKGESTAPEALDLLIAEAQLFGEGLRRLSSDSLVEIRDARSDIVTPTDPVPTYAQIGACGLYDDAVHEISVQTSRVSSRFQRGLKKSERALCKRGITFNRRSFDHVWDPLSQTPTQTKFTDLVATSEGVVSVQFVWTEWFVSGDVIDDGYRYYVVLDCKERGTRVAFVDAYFEPGEFNLGGREEETFANIPAGRCIASLYRVPHRRGEGSPTAFLNEARAGTFSPIDVVEIDVPARKPTKTGEPALPDLGAFVTLGPDSVTLPHQQGMFLTIRNGAIEDFFVNFSEFADGTGTTYVLNFFDPNNPIPLNPDGVSATLDMTTMPAPQIRLGGQNHIVPEEEYSFELEIEFDLTDGATGSVPVRGGLVGSCRMGDLGVGPGADSDARIGFLGIATVFE